MFVTHIFSSTANNVIYKDYKVIIQITLFIRISRHQTIHNLFSDRKILTILNLSDLNTLLLI